MTSPLPMVWVDHRVYQQGIVLSILLTLCIVGVLKKHYTLAVFMIREFVGTRDFRV
jgi:hypothetical protein